MGNLRKLTAGLVAGMALAALTSEVSAQTNLRIAVETPPGEPLNVMLTTFRDELQASAGDDVAIEFFESGAIGDEVALMEMIRVNEVQVVPLGSDVVQLDKKFGIFDAPFLFPSKEAAREALDGELGELLATSLREAANLQVLAFGELGFRAVSNNVRPIETPEDLKGLKLRTPGSETRIMAFTMLGAAPTPMNLGDVYVALRQGALDGQENPLSVVKEFSLFEVQKFISLTNHVYTPITFSMNGDAWDGLDDAMKEKVLAAAKAAATATRELSDKSDSELVGEFEAAGVTINKPDLAPFKEAAAPIHVEIGKVVGEDFMAQAVELAQ
jgi:tripartite ATP-independent transporter DctP family solute receptor